MKKIIYIFLFSFFFLSCEDVIEVELETTAPRLVIDASINWIKGTNGNIQFIQLSLTAPYYNNTIPPATGAVVTVADSNNNTFNFVEDGNSGLYANNSFAPTLNDTYTLTIVYNNETYVGTETLLPVPPIDFIEQNDGGGFSGDETEIKAYYTDPEGVGNYYLFEFIYIEDSTINIEVYDDEFTDGNQIFGFYSNEDISSGDELIIRNSGVSEQFYDYLNILLQQTDDDSGDPFQTQPATVRGNCINQTNSDNYPLGYFRVSETDIFTYVVE